MIRYSILDQSIATVGRPEGEAIRNTLALAELADRLGYARFWVSEHHNNATIVGSAPEVLMAAMAVRTQRIRIGSAGVMLPHYAPYKVAEQFRVLEALAPGRIDMGLGRAPGSDGRTAFALNPLANERPHRFPQDVRDLLAWVAGQPLPDGGPFAMLQAHPLGGTLPEPWILGSSDFGARLAAEYGLPYSFAWFFTDGRGAEEALALYHRHYRPSERFPRPRAGICVWVLAAESEEEARFHFASRMKWRHFRDRGVFAPLEPPEVAAAHAFTPEERAHMERWAQKSYVGCPEQIVPRLEALADSLQVEEVALVTWTWDEAARRRSYELLAGALELAPGTAPA